MTEKHTERQRRHRATSKITTTVNVPPTIGTDSSEFKVPEFVRLPQTGKRCDWTGLSRATLNELILGSRARVKSVVLRRHGATRGIRLINLSSLLGYLHEEMESQADQMGLWPANTAEGEGK